MGSISSPTFSLDMDLLAQYHTEHIPFISRWEGVLHVFFHIPCFATWYLIMAPFVTLCTIFKWSPPPMLIFQLWIITCWQLIVDVFRSLKFGFPLPEMFYLLWITFLRRAPSKEFSCAGWIWIHHIDCHVGVTALGVVERAHPAFV